MHGVHVRVEGWPAQAMLQAWGRSARGWPRLVVWDSPVRSVDGPERITIAAWVLAYRLTRKRHVPAARMTRIELPEDRSDWPAPRRVDYDCYLGDWDKGPARLPAGIEI